MTVMLAMSTFFLIDLPVIRSWHWAPRARVRRHGRQPRRAAGAARARRPTGSVARLDAIVGRPRGQTVGTLAGGVMRRPASAWWPALSCSGARTSRCPSCRRSPGRARRPPRRPCAPGGRIAPRLRARAAAPISVVVQLDRPLADDTSAAALLPRLSGSTPCRVRPGSFGDVAVGAAGVSEPRLVMSAQGRARCPAARSAVAHDRPQTDAPWSSSRPRRARRRVLTSETCWPGRSRGRSLNAEGVNVFVGVRSAEGLDRTRSSPPAALGGGTMLVVDLPAAARHLPLGLAAAQGDRDERRLGGGHLRGSRRGLPTGAGAGLLGFETSGHVTSFVPALRLTCCSA